MELARATPAKTDSQEKEADAMADRVLEGSTRLHQSPLSVPPSSGTATGLGAGMPLPDALRAYFEPRFGQDFSAVRLHHDAGADQAARSLRARAFAVGNSIAFRAGEYAPQTERGQRLLAHELTHVTQSHDRLRRTPDNNAAAQPTPEEAMALALSRIDEVVPRYQEAVDAGSEGGILAIGRLIATGWTVVEEQRRTIVAPSSTLASGQPAPENPLPAGLQTQYDQTRRSVLITIVGQKFQGRYLLGAERMPPGQPADLTPFIESQASQVAWAAKDARAAIALLRRDSLPETEQWTVVGLLRQHLSSANFAYMRAMIATSGTELALGRFAAGPFQALTMLMDLQRQLAQDERGAPGSVVGELEMIPAENKVRLVQPFSPQEVAAQLFGDTGLWRSLLLPLNGGILAGNNGQSWLPAGTELWVDPETLRDEYRNLFLSAREAQRTRREAGSDLYLSAQPETAVLAVGNHIQLSLLWPHSAYSSVRLSWFERPVGGAERFLASGIMSWSGGGNRNASIDYEARDPGAFEIICQVTHPDGSIEHLTHLQHVVTPEEKVQMAFDTQRTGYAYKDELLASLRQERDRPGISAERRAAIVARLELIERTLRDDESENRRWGRQSGVLMPIRAVFVSREDRPQTIPLSLYYRTNPGYFDDSHNTHLQLFDFTGGYVGPYEADAPGIGTPGFNAAMGNLLRHYAYASPYGRGVIRFNAPEYPLARGPMGGGAVTFPTADNRAAAGFRRASFGLLMLGLVSAGVGVIQPETLPVTGPVATTAFAASGISAGIGGALSLYDRAQHGVLDFNLETGMDVLDIASAILTAGAASKAIRGVLNIERLNVTVGGVQMAIMGATHIAAITAAAQSGNRDRIQNALLDAVRDGALIFITHRVTARMQRLQEQRTRIGPDGRPVPIHETDASGERRTASGTAPTTGGATGSPPLERVAPPRGAAGRDTVAFGTPEYHDQVWDVWAAERLQGGMAARPAQTAAPAGPPIREGYQTFQTGLTTPEAAYAAYEQALARAPGREVGMYQNLRTGEFCVRVGTPMELFGPVGDGWVGRIHYHPNPNNVLIVRNPAPADFMGTSRDSMRRGGPSHEFVEHELPGGGRGVTYFATDMTTGRVTTEHQMPNGERVTRTFANLSEYQRWYFERETFLEPGSPEYDWVLRDIDDFYEGRRRDGYTTSGAVPPGTPPPGPAPAASAPVPVPAAGSPAAVDALVAARPRLTAHASDSLLTQGYRLEQVRYSDFRGRPSGGGGRAGGPQAIEANVIYEFPNGARTWRDRAGNIRTEARLGASLGQRSGFEDRLPARAGQDRAHGSGQSLAHEDPLHLHYSSPRFNQIAENLYVEAYERRLAQLAESGSPAGGPLYVDGAPMQLRRTVVTTPQSPQRGLRAHSELTSRIYRVEIVHPDGRIELVSQFGVRLDASGNLDRAFFNETAQIGGSPEVHGLLDHVMDEFPVARMLSSR